MESISAKSWMRFDIPNFSVEPKVMGSSHKFILDDFRIEIKLPKKDHVNKGPKFDEVASLTSWKSITEEPLVFEVHKVDLEIKLKEKISIPQDAINSTNVDVSLFDENSRKKLNNVTNEYAEISDRALQYWLEILRWSTGYPFIGKQFSHANKSGWGTYLINESTENRVYCGTQVIVIPKDYLVTYIQWELTQTRLSKNLQLPMYIKFIHDAQSSIKIGNCERAIVELALACENYLRYSVFDYLPSGLQKEFVEYIEEANINQYLNRFFNNIVEEKDKTKFKKIKKDISSLISRRNSYMHMGTMKDAHSDNFNRYLSAVENLILIEKSNIGKLSN